VESVLRKEKKSMFGMIYEKAIFKMGMTADEK